MTQQTKKLGLSLSFCIKDIVEGKVNIEDVHHIITGCSPVTSEDVLDIVKQYKEVYWRKYPEKAEEVFNTLWNGRRIMWCSTFDKNPPNIARTNWATIEV